MKVRIQRRERYFIASPYGRDRDGRLVFPMWRSHCRSRRPAIAKFIWRPCHRRLHGQEPK